MASFLTPGMRKAGSVLQDGVARATGFGDAPGHPQAGHQYSLRARKIRLALEWRSWRGTEPSSYRPAKK